MVYLVVMNETFFRLTSLKVYINQVAVTKTDIYLFNQPMTWRLLISTNLSFINISSKYFILILIPFVRTFLPAELNFHNQRSKKLNMMF